MRRFITTPFRAILWREWRESWFALPVALGCVIAGGLVNRQLGPISRVDQGFYLLAGMGMGLALAAGILMVFLGDRRQASLVPPRDWLRLPVSTPVFAGSLLLFRAAYFVGIAIAVQAVAAWVFAPEWHNLSEALTRMLRIHSVEPTYADALLLPLVFFLVLQGGTWLSGPVAGYLLAAAAVGIGGVGAVSYLYANISAVFIFDHRLLAAAGIAGGVAAWIGFHAQRRDRHSSLRLSAFSTRRPPRRRCFSPTAAQRWYDRAPIALVYAAGVLIISILLVGLGLFPMPRLSNPQIYPVLFMASALGVFARSATFVCAAIGVYWIFAAVRVRRGAASRYLLSLPVSPAVMTTARVQALLQLLSLHLLATLAAALFWIAIALFSGVPVGIVEPSIDYEVRYGMFTPFVEMAAAMALGLAGGVLSALFIGAGIPLWLTWNTALVLIQSIAPDKSNLLATLLLYFAECFWLVPWLFIVIALRSRQPIPRPIFLWSSLFFPPAFVAVLLFSPVDVLTPGPEWLLAAAIALLPVTAYFTWLALFTRMRGR